MPKDEIGVKDHAGATLNAVTAPRHPCPLCGKETKEHTDEEVSPGVIRRRRICSDKSCRKIIVELGPN